MWVLIRASMGIGIWLLIAVPVFGWLHRLVRAEALGTAMFLFLVLMGVSGCWLCVIYWYVKEHSKEGECGND